MRLQAPFRFGNSMFHANSAADSGPIRRVCVLSAVACAMVAITGCGGGVLGVTPPQSVATPVASAKGPQLGYLWIASDKTLRPILGVPGASQIGQSVVPAGVYAQAVASATSSIAVLQDTGGAFDLMMLPSGSVVSLNVTLPVGASIRLSPAATSALMYSPGATFATLVTGLLTTPAIHSIQAPGAISDSAVSDAGSVGFEYLQGSSTAIGVAPLDGRTAPIASVRAIGGLSFLPGVDDLLFADGSANTLTLMRSSSTAPSRFAIQTAQLLNGPSTVAVSGSGRWALVANRGNQNLVRVDLATLTGIAVACSCQPTTAATLADDGAFRVTDTQSGPNWMVDASIATPRLLFIPALPATQKTSLVASAVVP